MNYNKKQIILRDGTEAVLRSPSREDANGLIDLIVTSSGESDFLLSSPGEVSFTEEQEADFIAKGLEGQSSLMIVCTVNGIIAGNCGVQFMTHLKTHHRATLGITVRKKYWNLGIGSAMLEAAIQAASEHGTEQLELEYIEGNDRARAMYEKFGFVTTGELPDAIRLADGSSKKLICMIKRLGDGVDE